MHDQRVEARPSLRLVDAGNCLRVRGVSREPVNRLGRHRDGFAKDNKARSLGNALAGERKDRVSIGTRLED